MHSPKWKKAIWSIWFQLSVVRKRQQLRRQWKDQRFPKFGDREGQREHVFRDETILYDTSMLDPCPYIPVQTHWTYSTSISPDAAPELWVVMMYQCGFIDGNTCTTVVLAVPNEDGCMWGDREYMELLVLSSQFCYEPKTVVKIKFYFFKSQWITECHMKYIFTNICNT